MHVPQVVGSVTDAAHSEWIELVDLKWGVSRPNSGPYGSTGSGTPNFTNVVVSKQIDTATPALFILSCNGRTMNEIVIEAVRTSGDRHTECRYTFSKSSVAGVKHRVEGSGHEAVLYEDVEVRFAQIKVEYTALDATGAPRATTQAAWSVEENRSV